MPRQEDTEPKQPSPQGSHKIILGVLCATSVIGALLFMAMDWWQHSRFIESTDNSYVEGEITGVTTRVAGYVTELMVSDNQSVRKGDILLKIDDRELLQQITAEEAEINRLQAEADTLSLRRELQNFYVQQAEAELTIAKAEMTRSKSELTRIAHLLKSGSNSKQEYDTSVALHARAQGSLLSAEASLKARDAETRMINIEQSKLDALIQKTKSNLNIQRIRLKDTVIRSPIDGVIGNRSVREGEYVSPGRFLMAIVPLDEVWVVANFKETQLTDMSVGQPVNIEVDTFPDVVIQGRVSGFSPASGAEFSLLPPQNATGNFTKIVQRIPVKISIEPDAAVTGRLVPGMSTVVSVDTKQVDPGTDSDPVVLAGQD